MLCYWLEYDEIRSKHIVVIKCSVIQKDGLNFVILYFKIRTNDKYDVNYIWLYSQWSLLMFSVLPCSHTGNV
jgi:hypothetical protein